MRRWVEEEGPLTNHRALSIHQSAAPSTNCEGPPSLPSAASARQPSQPLARRGLPTGAASNASARRRLVGLSRFELLTPRLSSVCSNQLSYRPSEPTFSAPLVKEPARLRSSRSDGAAGSFKTEQDVSSKLPGGYQIDLSVCPPSPLRASARQSLERR